MKSGLLGILKNVDDLDSVLILYLFNDKNGLKFKIMFKGISTGHAKNISINHNKI